MLSVIKKQERFSELLDSLEHVVEVYSSVEFSMDCNYAYMFFLVRHPINSVRALMTLNELFPVGIKFYIVTDQYSNLLNGKRIIWRDGVWYV